MFSLINQYKVLILSISQTNLEALNSSRNADSNNDGILTSSEFYNLSVDERRRIQSDLQRIRLPDSGETLWDVFVRERRLVLSRYQREQDSVVGQTRQEEHEHRSHIEAGRQGINILSGQRLTRAVGFINRNLSNAQQTEIFSQLTRLGFTSGAMNSSELAQATARFQAANRLTTDGMPGRNTQAALGSNPSTQERPESGAQERTRRPQGQEAMRTTISRRAQPIINALRRSITPAVNSRQDFQTLTRSIFTMQQRGQFDENVWNQFINLAQNLGWNDFLSHINSTRLRDNDKYLILTNGIAESAMGGRGIFELLNRPNVTIEELASFETNNRRDAMLNVLSQESGLPQSALLQARNEFLQNTPRNLSTTTFNRGEIFSTRRQQRGDGVLQGVQGFLNHNIVSLRGRRNYIPVNFESPQLVNRLSEPALENIQRQIQRDGGGRFTLEQIKQNLINRSTVRGVRFDYELGYFKSADCFNDAIGVIPKIRVPRRTSDGGGSPDGPGPGTTNPGRDPVGATTNTGSESASGSGGGSGANSGGASGSQGGGAGVLG